MPLTPRATAAWVRRVVSQAAIDLAAGSTVGGVGFVTTAYTGLKAAIEAIGTAIALPAGTTIGGSSLVTTAYGGLQAAIEALTTINLDAGTTYDGKTILATDGSAISLPTGSTLGGVPLLAAAVAAKLTVSGTDADSDRTITITMVDGAGAPIAAAVQYQVILTANTIADNPTYAAGWGGAGTLYSNCLFGPWGDGAPGIGTNGGALFTFATETDGVGALRLQNYASGGFDPSVTWSVYVIPAAAGGDEGTVTIPAMIRVITAGAA